MSARHKLQPRLPKPNQAPDTFPKKQTKQRWAGPIYLSAHIYKLLSQEVRDALQKYNAEAIQKLKSTRNFHEKFLHDLHENTHDKRHLKSWASESRFPHDQGGSIICQLIKYLQKFFAI